MTTTLTTSTTMMTESTTGFTARAYIKMQRHPLLGLKLYFLEITRHSRSV